MNVFELNNSLHNEGNELLDKTKLLEKLKAFGELEIGGSFIYGTMVDRDIDINVIVNREAINTDLRKQVCDMLLGLDYLDGLALSDRALFPKEGRPYGIWFGPLVYFQNSKWNIDIWLVTREDPYSHHNQDLAKRMLTISDDQRKIILDIKYNSLVNGQKEKGITSSDIYLAVLDKNITTYDDYLNIIP